MHRSAASLLAVALVVVPASAAPQAPVPPPSVEAQQAFLKIVEGARNPTERADRLAYAALVQRPGGELQQLLDRALDEEILEAKGALRQIFVTGDEVAKVRVMQLYSRHWRTQLGVGYEPAFVETVRRGLEDPSEKVRQATIAFTAENHVPRIANFLIDAAEAHPDLTLGALLSIEQSRDPIGARWVTGKIGDGNAAIRDAALLATSTMGRRGAFFLRAMVESPDPKVCRAGVQGLLVVAESDDRSFLAAWLERDTGAPAELREQVVRTVAELEIGTYEPALPKRPALAFPG
jgi:hypothetical protein